MTDANRELYDWLVQSERQHLGNASARQPAEQPRTIHHTELPEDTSSEPIAQEWNLYRREVCRLLAEGHEGRWVLIKGEEIVGIWDTEDEANRVRLERFLMQHVLMKQIREWEPILRGGGYHRQWR